MADNLKKRPAKGILKNSSSFDQQDQQSNTNSRRTSTKETKWDEMNIIATLHPPDKEYGHMKIDEPPTPYNYEFEDRDDHDGTVLDPAILAEKIRQGALRPSKVLQEEDAEDDEDSDDYAGLSEEQIKIKKEFEMRRKKHYNEFYAVKLARKLLEEEDDEEDDDEGGAGTSKVANTDCCDRKACPKKGQ